MYIKTDAASRAGCLRLRLRSTHEDIINPLNIYTSDNKCYEMCSIFNKFA